MLEFFKLWDDTLAPGVLTRPSGSLAGNCISCYKLRVEAGSIPDIGATDAPEVYFMLSLVAFVDFLISLNQIIKLIEL